MDTSDNAGTNATHISNFTNEVSSNDNSLANNKSRHVDTNTTATHNQ